MLCDRRHDVSIRERHQDRVVRLARARREEDLARRHAEQRRHRVARALDGRPRRRALRVHARRVAPLRAQSAIHRVRDLVAHG
jgi:hypothetical protein